MDRGNRAGVEKERKGLVLCSRSVGLPHEGLQDTDIQKSDS